MLQNWFSVVAGIFQLLLIIAFGVFVEYNDDKSVDDSANYPFFQHVHIMLFVGIGFLHSFLKKYSFGSIGHNLMIGALMLQWSIIAGGILRMVFDLQRDIIMNVNTLLMAEYATAAVLISFGAILGKVDRLQLFLFGVIEVFFYFLNQCVIVKYIKIADVGGTITLHVFAAFYGLTVSRIIYKKEHRDSENEASDYQSNVFTILGIFFPSFNSAGIIYKLQRQRAIFNTYFSMASCCATIFILSSCVTKKYKTNMVHVQNASLAGGVVIGACANLRIGIWAALLLGVLGGIVCVLGFHFLQPRLLNRWNFHDTAGVLILHGLPGILGACASAIAAYFAKYGNYEQELFQIFEARKGDYDDYTVSSEGDARTETIQALMQIVAMVITIMVAILSGIISGLLLRCWCISAEAPQSPYDDEHFWLQAERVIADDELSKTEEQNETRELLEVNTEI